MASFHFMDKGTTIRSFEDWCSLQEDAEYRTVAIDRIGQWFVITEWIGVGQLRFRTRVFNLTVEQEQQTVHKSRNEKEATQTHKEIVTSLIRLDPEYTSHAAKETCVLCGSPMKLQYGKHGEFFSCTAWIQTGCPGTVSKDGRLSKKTREALSQLTKQTTTEEDSDNLEDRLDLLELD